MRSLVSEGRWLVSEVNHLRSTVLRKMAQRLGIDATNDPVEAWVKIQTDVEVLSSIEHRHSKWLNKLWTMLHRK